MCFLDVAGAGRSGIGKSRPDNDRCGIMNPYLVEFMVREKREDLLREAKRQQLIAQYEAGRPRAGHRLALALADLLIRVGERLKRRFAGQLNLPAS